ncbi:uncharacterized protein LOC108675513 [Hyalella azteca]|uniref:Uncharacterized protein LOC108675513 n=1 Tax=Hyalella azteca TaxID=294128 RepID=A0A8B7P1T0_HYAAZ|nr:uncharacterized protein LOC108675513 [Hyalella azteca]
MAYKGLLRIRRSINCPTLTAVILITITLMHINGTSRPTFEPPRTVSKPQRDQQHRHIDGAKIRVPADGTNENFSLPTKKPILNWENFFDYIEEAAGCNNLKMFGGAERGRSGQIDGDKAVCLDTNVAPTPGSCIVLSFGINNEWSFDDAMEQYGCKVYAFDPTMGEQAYLRGSNIHFYPWALGGETGVAKFRGKNRTICTYRDILKKINEEKSVIDYLKIDVEGFEIDFFRNVLNDDVELLANVKQIGMEIHPGRSTTNRDKIWSQIRQLRSLHFSQVSSLPNVVAGNSYKFENKTVSQCYEILWVNEQFQGN